VRPLDDSYFDFREPLPAGDELPKPSAKKATAWSDRPDNPHLEKERHLISFLVN
jgi:hypothetical protein